jgi:hypothetical protein
MLANLTLQCSLASADNQDVPIWLVGTDGGLLRRPVRIQQWTHEVFMRHNQQPRE